MARLRTTPAFFAPVTRPAPGIGHVRVSRRPGTLHHGLFRIGATTLPCALGRSGITRFKREGDGATPAGRLELLHGFWRADRALPPTAPIRLTPLAADAGWCDDPEDGRYNRPVRLPFHSSHETMRRADDLYDVVVVLDWNLRRRIVRGGSAIFFHQARPGYEATAGCIALAPADMRRILPRLRSGASILVV